jgi:hypothetical protein
VLRTPFEGQTFTIVIPLMESAFPALDKMTEHGFTSYNLQPNLIEGLAPAVLLAQGPINL